MGSSEEALIYVCNVTSFDTLCAIETYIISCYEMKLPFSFRWKWIKNLSYFFFHFPFRYKWYMLLRPPQKKRKKKKMLIEGVVWAWLAPYSLWAVHKIFIQWGREKIMVNYTNYPLVFLDAKKFLYLFCPQIKWGFKEGQN